MIYSDSDAFVGAWLRELIADGQLAPGIVDGRSITELTGEDLQGHDRVHLFAGIGGWEYALQLAGWPADEPVWTGSCPCQPFSVAGKGKGAADERHLWPEMFRLIRECRPNTIFGEQVPNAVGKGWLDGVFAELEAEGYTCGACVLGAHSVGAPHIRQRLYWVADSGGRGGMVNSVEPGLEGHSGHGNRGREPGRQHQEKAGSAWAASEPAYCRDGKYRRIPLERSLFPMAPRLPNRVGILRGSGNAIVPQTAAAFVTAYMEGR